MPSQLKSLPLSLIKDTRTRTSRFDEADDEHKSWFGKAAAGSGPLLPVANKGGGYYTRKTRSSRGTAGGGRKFWSPYARPPRRSRRLVVVWLCGFLIAGLLTWWISTRHMQMARSYAEVLVHQPEKVPVVDG